ncbi:MAG: hypothetical protein SGILL_006057, partial [Bacillariaceae sp.]
MEKVIVKSEEIEASKAGEAKSHPENSKGHSNRSSSNSYGSSKTDDAGVESRDDMSMDDASSKRDGGADEREAVDSMHSKKLHPKSSPNSRKGKKHSSSSSSYEGYYPPYQQGRGGPYAPPPPSHRGPHSHGP